MSACPNCGYSRKADAFAARVRKRMRERVEIGLGRMRAGDSVRDAAVAAGYHDESTFSRACVKVHGERPYAVVRRRP